MNTFSRCFQKKKKLLEYLIPFHREFTHNTALQVVHRKKIAIFLLKEVTGFEKDNMEHELNELKDAF